jgi:hypothetical protein
MRRGRQPHLDLVVITTRHEEGLRLVEVHTTDRSIVLVKFVDQRAHSVIVQLKNPRMETCQHPRPLRVKGNA